MAKANKRSVKVQAQKAAMSALIVSAILGVGVSGAMAATTDNVTRVSSGTTLKLDSEKTIQGLDVAGGTVYVSATTGDGFTVLGGVNQAGRAHGVSVSGGSLYIGKSDASTVQPGAKLTADNMTISGGLVEVSNASTLHVKDGELEISGGQLTLNNGLVKVDATGKGVIVKGTGTLHAKGGVDNVVATNFVHLKGGTISVAKDSGLTIAGTSGGLSNVGKANGAANDVNAGFAYGSLNVISGGNLQVSGGRINAHLKSAGTTNFDGGTTTVDNMTISGGTTTISGGATVITGDNSEINANGKLEMRGGTLQLADGKGTLLVKGSGELNATANVNTVRGNVDMSGSGKVNVTGAADLTITGGLTAVTGTQVNVESGSLTVGGAVKADAGTIQVGHASDDTKRGTLNMGFASLKSADVKTNAITLGDGATKAVKSGTLILTGYGSTVKVSDVATVVGKVAGGEFNDTYTNNTVVFWGSQLVDSNDTVVKAEIAGNGSITAGVAVTVTGDNPTLSGNILAPSIVTTGDVAVSGTVDLIGIGQGNATNQTSTLKSLDISGTVNVSDGAGLIVNTTTEMKAGSKLNVTNTGVSLGEFKASGGTMFVDPAYVKIDGVSTDWATTLYNGNGGIVDIANAPGWAKDAIAKTGVVNPSTLVLGQTLTLTGTGQLVLDTNVDVDGKIPVAGTPTAVTDGVYLGKNSLLIVDMSKMSNDYVLKLSGSGDKLNAVVGADAKIFLRNLQAKNDGIRLIETTGTITSTGWDSATGIIQPDRMLTGTLNTTTGVYSVAVKSGSSWGMSGAMDGLMSSVWSNSRNNLDSNNAGIRFVSRAANSHYIRDGKQAAATIEGAAQLASVGAVQGSALAAASAGHNAINTRTGIANTLSANKAFALNVDNEGKISSTGMAAGDSMKNGLGLWITPLYQSRNMYNMKAENFETGYNSNLGGVALGVDYTINEMFRFGLGLNMGGGFAQSNGDFNDTTNRFNFWGVNLYGGWTANNFGLTADVSYTGTYNQLEQDMTQGMAMDKLKGDVNASIWSVGVQGEYKFETSVMDIIPHVGVRYTGLTTNEYDVKSSGTVFKVNEDFQNIWTFPIGVTFSKSIETGSGWMFKPKADIGVIFAAGDLDAKSKVRIPGASSSAEMKTQVVDYTTFDGGLGFDFSNNNLSLGINYNIQISEHATNHGVFGTVRYEF